MRLLSQQQLLMKSRRLIVPPLRACRALRKLSQVFRVGPVNSVSILKMDSVLHSKADPAHAMSALPPKGDIRGATAHVCFGPKADSAATVAKTCRSQPVACGELRRAQLGLSSHAHFPPTAGAQRRWPRIRRTASMNISVPAGTTPEHSRARTDSAKPICGREQ